MRAAPPCGCSTQVLGRDIRSFHQRAKGSNGSSSSSSGGGGGAALVTPATPQAGVLEEECEGASVQPGRWRVVLEGVEVSYDQDERGVRVYGARRAS